MHDTTAPEGPLRDVAAEIHRLLQEVITLQSPYVAEVCSRCEEPCCMRVQDLFDEKDLIFLRTFPAGNVPGRRKRRTGCPFLSSKGCVLIPEARPFTCHRYLCDSLKEEMLAKDPGLIPLLNEKLGRLEDLRGRLFRAYLLVLHQLHRQNR